MEDVPGGPLAAAFAFLPAACLIQASLACTCFLPVSRADRLWLPWVSRRWRFGSGPASTEPLPPGERDLAATRALAIASEGPLGSSSDAFAFFLRRCRRDVRVAALVLQLAAAEAAGRAEPADSTGSGARELQPGDLVRIGGLQKAPRYNGCSGVIVAVPAWALQRFDVALPSLAQSIQVLAANDENLVLEARVSASEAEHEVHGLGTEAIDALARVASALRNAGQEMPGRARMAAAAGRLLAKATEQWAVLQWEVLMSDGRMNLLEEGGFVVAQWADPGAADVALLRSRLAALADDAATCTSHRAPLRERIEAVNHILFSKFRLSGDMEDYHDPRNSLLHHVLERRRGIPISLSIIWAAVARRVQVPCYLCAKMPGHLLIRVETGTRRPQDDLYVDAFNRRVMSYSELLDFAQSTGITPFQDGYVEQCPAELVYVRVLSNLMHIYEGTVPRARRELKPAWCDLRLLAGAAAQAAVIQATSGTDNRYFLRVRADAEARAAQAESTGR